MSASVSAIPRSGVVVEAVLDELADRALDERRPRRVVADARAQLGAPGAAARSSSARARGRRAAHVAYRRSQPSIAAGSPVGGVQRRRRALAVLGVDEQAARRVGGQRRVGRDPPPAEPDLQARARRRSTAAAGSRGTRSATGARRRRATGARRPPRRRRGRGARARAPSARRAPGRRRRRGRCARRRRSPTSCRESRAISPRTGGRGSPRGRRRRGRRRRAGG